MMHELIAGIDLSTQSCTVEVRRADTFEQVGIASRPLTRAVPPISEQHPHEWWTTLVETFEMLRASGIATTRIDSVSIGAQCHGLVPLGADNEVLQKAKLWNDTTGAPYVAELVNRFGKRFWIERVQSNPTAAVTIAKLAWLKANRPETFERLSSILLPHDYLTFRLTGKKVTDRSEASGTGYFDSIGNVYRFDLLADCFGSTKKWDAMVPEVLGPNEPAGTVISSSAEELGLRPGVVVGAGGGDQHLAALGIGLADSEACFSLGTSGVVFASSAQPIQDWSGIVNGVASVTGGWLPLVCTLNCTQVTDRFAELMGTTIYNLGEEALSADITAARPSFAAYLGGERSPQLPNAAGSFFGVTNQTGRSEFALSIFEGIILGLVQGLDQMKNCGIEISGQIVVIGGGARSQAYLQVLSDHLGTAVVTVDAPEATARGAALQALAVLRSDPIDKVRDKYLPRKVSVTHPRAGVVPSWVKENYQRACEYASRIDYQ